jgi:hypothetical protein
VKWFKKKHAPPETPNTDFTGVFAVTDSEPWWLAVHQVINEAESETVTGARNRTANPHLCIAAVGAGEGIDLVRQKLLDKRQLALKQNASNLTSTTRLPRP